jgi:hydroxyethylthiazole kinase-like sugar kinase family protein
LSQPPIHPLLPPNTIVPINEDLFIPYLNKLYQDIASAVNSKDPKYYPMAITSTAQNILNVSNFGAYVICVSGTTSTLPTITASLCKADSTAAGSIAVLGSQVGTVTWAGNALTITSTATNFQIAHNRTGVTGNFYIKLIGTQGLI